MGCGESKHAVATQNTVTKNPSKISNSTKKTVVETNAPVENKGTDDQNANVTPVQESESVVKDLGNGNAKENEPVKADDKGKAPEKPEEKVKANEAVEGEKINEEAKPKAEIKEEAPKVDEAKAVEPSDETKILPPQKKRKLLQLKRKLRLLHQKMRFEGEAENIEDVILALMINHSSCFTIYATSEDRLTQKLCILFPICETLQLTLNLLRIPRSFFCVEM